MNAGTNILIFLLLILQYLYGDKIPNFLEPSLRCLIDNKKCGFDFSGIISEVPSDCNYKVGDKVFLC
jgi:hypothetical protein